MKPRAFDYVRAETLDEALTALAEGGEDVKVLAGGQSLVAILNFRLAEPNLLVDINRIHELNYIKVNGDMIEIGAAKTQAELQDCLNLEINRLFWSRQSPILAIFKRAIAARYAARWRMLIQVRNCRFALRRWAVRSCCGQNRAHAP